MEPSMNPALQKRVGEPNLEESSITASRPRHAVVRISELSPEFVEQAAALYMHAFTTGVWSEEKWTMETAKKELRDLEAQKSCFCAVFSQTGRILGFASATPLENCPHKGDFSDFEVQPQTLYFAEFCVVDECRGSGMGTALLKDCCDYAEEHGYEAILTRTKAGNHGATRAFEKAGFSFIGESEAVTGGAASLRVVYQKVLRCEKSNA